MKNSLKLTIVGFFLFTSLLCKGATNHWETAIFTENNWKYFVGQSAPPTNWYTSEFNDLEWNSATGGFGYGDIKTGTILPNTAISVFLRISFNITDTSAITEGVLSMDYDDAFVAFLNGVEIVRTAGLIDTFPAYNTLSTVDHESKMYNGGKPEAFHFSKKILSSILKPGLNYLAIQVHNKANSSDLTANPFLSFGISNSKVYYTSSPLWLINDFTSSNLPIINIDTKGKAIVDEPKIMAKMGIMYNGPDARNNANDSFNHYNGNIGIELRGATSQWFAEKKSYAFETLDSVYENYNCKLLALPKENDWVLYSEFADNSMLRNSLVFDLGNKMGRWAPRTKHCELILNGEYNGVYELMEKVKIDKNRVNIDKLEPADLIGDAVTGGYVIKIDRGYDGTNGFVSAYKVNNKAINFVYVYPKPADIAPAQRTYINTYVSNFEKIINSANYKDSANGYRKYIDVPSFVDYFIINELSKNVDAYRLSSFLYKDRDSKGGKLVAGPLWDYNLAFGNADYYTADSEQGWIYNAVPASDGSQVPIWWSKLFDDSSFQNQLKCRWTELRKSVLHFDSIANFIDRKAEFITEAQQRDFGVWPTTLKEGSFNGELNFMKEWISGRLTWMDINLPGTCEVETGTKPLLAIGEIAIWPNPFKNNVNFEINTSKNGNALIVICDVTGRRIIQTKCKIDNNTGHFCWNGTNDFKMEVASGVYLYSITIDNQLIKSGKLIRVCP